MNNITSATAGAILTRLDNFLRNADHLYAGGKHSNEEYGLQTKPCTLLKYYNTYFSIAQTDTRWVGSNLSTWISSKINEGYGYFPSIAKDAKLLLDSLDKTFVKGICTQRLTV